MYKADSHIHSNFSGDSMEKLENIIERAIETGMDEITITDHLDLEFPGEVNIFELDFKTYVETLKKLKNLYKNNIKIKIGIELGLQPQLKNKYNEIFNCEDVDFIIGSFHCVRGMDVADRKFFEKYSKDEAHRIYFEEILNTIDLFPEISVCGHLDFINRYGRSVYDDYKKINFEMHRELIDKILIKLIEKNIGIEINTSALRYGLRDFHPCRKILKRYKELGGKIITMGSDAHRALDIMRDFDKARDVLKEIGFENFCVFEKRKAEYKEL